MGGGHSELGDFAVEDDDEQGFAVLISVLC